MHIQYMHRQEQKTNGDVIKLEPGNYLRVVNGASLLNLGNEVMCISFLTSTTARLKRIVIYFQNLS